MLITIDSESTRDIDDAISVTPTQDGGCQLRIAIADPAALVPMDSPTDIEARRLASTVYLRDHVAHRMLPAAISEDQASLVQDQDRAAVVFDIELDAALEPVGYRASAQPVRVTHRLHYEQIPDILADPTDPLREPLEQTLQLAQRLLAKRRQRGALAIYDMAQLLMTNEEGAIVRAKNPQAMLGNIIVQEMMILTNSLAGASMVESNVPAIFRNHHRQASAPDSQVLANTIQGWLDGRALDSGAVRSQFQAIIGRANYGHTVEGHYGLNLPVYLHITSPLRRYADLVNMRQLVAHLNGQPMPYTSAALAEISQELNDTLTRRREARAQGYKTGLRRTVARELAAERLQGLADHEIDAAIKIMDESGRMDPGLEAEIVGRLQSDSLGAACVARLVFKTSGQVLTPGLRQALASWLAQAPARAVSLANMGAQTQCLVMDAPQTESTEGGFVATVRLQTGPNNRATTQAQGRGRAARKNQAVQLATVQAFTRLLGLASDADQESASAQPEFQSQPPDAATPDNARGRLQELCQALKLPSPVFSCKQHGPAHAPQFDVLARVMVGDRRLEASIEGAASKKAGIAQAAHLLFERVQATAKPPSMSMPDRRAANPITALQEFAQKGRLGLPTYSFSMAMQDERPVFECVAQIALENGDLLVERGRGNRKQQAKEAAANSMIQRLSDQAACDRTSSAHRSERIRA